MFQDESNEEFNMLASRACSSDKSHDPTVVHFVPRPPRRHRQETTSCCCPAKVAAVLCQSCCGALVSSKLSRSLQLWSLLPQSSVAILTVPV
uniref:Uncharacterized protein n=1 Tax=Physcomitrium patens TaxID=3218 RepID=A0A2K1KJQ1_PHYPA|nr:hypothetical protein PHYPA_007675 [Physcomitrium patens]